MEFKRTTEIVRGLLINNPSNRDCDKKLIANVLFLQAKAKGFDPTKITMMDFLEEFVNGDTFVNPESVRRARARLQEIHEGLRGKTYNDRIKVAENRAKKEISEI